MIHNENILVLDDLNFDMLDNQKCTTLNDMCDVFNLSQLVSKETCFMKGFTPSLVDVILTNQKNLCFNVLNIPTGVSDCHNLISVTVKTHVNRPKQEYIKYRSYKNFDVTNFNEDISKINVATSENLSSKEQLNNVYENYNRSF
jgi:hypothetical protein